MIYFQTATLEVADTLSIVSSNHVSVKIVNNSVGAFF